MRTRNRRIALGLMFLLGSASSLAAQDAPAPVAPPTYTGRDRATGPASRAAGGIYELSNSARLVIPAGLPIGTSRVLTFSTSRAAVRPADVAAGFTRQGPTLAFDGAIDATRAPVELSIRAARLRIPANSRLVLAIEIAGVCDATHTHHISTALCSTWQTIDAHYDENAGRILAAVPSPGGYRLQFGFVHEAPPAEDVTRPDF